MSRTQIPGGTGLICANPPEGSRCPKGPELMDDLELRM